MDVLKILTANGTPTFAHFHIVSLEGGLFVEAFAAIIIFLIGKIVVDDDDE